MKTEERKKEDCELLYDFMVYSMKQERTGFKDVLNQFKADNDLLPKRIELSKEEWNERIGEVQVKINELEEKLNELRKLV